MKKKVISYICLLSVFCSFVIVGSGCKDTDKWFMSTNAEYTETEKGTPLPVYSRTYEFIGGSDVMPIGSYGGPIKSKTVNGVEVDSFITAEKFELIKAIGLNFFEASVDGASDWINLQRTLELCDEYKIGIFAEDTSIGRDGAAASMTTEKLNAKVSKYLDYNSFLGIFLQDEPNAEKIKTLKNTMQAWKGSSLVRDKDMYCNALPDYATGTQLSGKDEPITYEEYMRTYIEELGIDYFSYDYYPFQNWGVISQGYFGNLSTVRNICQEYAIPFWAFIQCGGDWGYGWTECIPDTEGKFLWNVNTNLAYGAKGMQYFMLTQWEGFLSANDSLSATRSGLFGAFGNINRWYYFAKKANAWITAIDQVLMNATNVGVIFHGKSPTKASTGEEVLTAGKFRQLTSVQGDDSLVGCFDYYGGTALMVVNNSVKKSDANIILTFDGVYGYQVYQRDSVTDIAGNALQLKLDVGEAALVVLK